MSEDLLGKWALNLMLINVSTRRFGRAVRLPEGDISAATGTGVSKSAPAKCRHRNTAINHPYLPTCRAQAIFATVTAS
jgi:hypothetical protein